MIEILFGGGGVTSSTPPNLRPCKEFDDQISLWNPGLQ